MSVPVGVLRAPVYFQPGSFGPLWTHFHFPFGDLQHRLVAGLMTT